MPRYRIDANDTVVVPALPGSLATTQNALGHLKFVAGRAAIHGAKFKQNQQPGFSNIYRLTLPNDDALFMFEVSGGNLLDEFKV